MPQVPPRQRVPAVEYLPLHASLGGARNLIDSPKRRQRRAERTTLSRDVAQPRPSLRSGDEMSRFLHKFALRREVLLETSRVVITAVIRALISELVSWLI